MNSQRKLPWKSHLHQYLSSFFQQIFVIIYIIRHDYIPEPSNPILRHCTILLCQTQNVIQPHSHHVLSGSHFYGWVNKSPYDSTAAPRTSNIWPFSYKFYVLTNCAITARQIYEANWLKICKIMFKNKIYGVPQIFSLDSKIRKDNIVFRQQDLAMVSGFRKQVFKKQWPNHKMSVGKQLKVENLCLYLNCSLLQNVCVCDQINLNSRVEASHKFLKK